MRRIWTGCALVLFGLTSCAHHPAQEAYEVRGTALPPEVSFRGEPGFVEVTGTGTYWSDNTVGNYDLYRYGTTYYIVSSDHWFRSVDARGPYENIEEGTVPEPVMHAIEQRRQLGDQSLGYSRNDTNRDEYRPNEMWRASLRVRFDERPRFREIEDTGVFRCLNPPGDFELYRYAGGYYVLRSGRWYRNDEPEGTFDRVRHRAVPQRVLSLTTDEYGRTWERDRGD